MRGKSIYLILAVVLIITTINLASAKDLAEYEKNYTLSYPVFENNNSKAVNPNCTISITDPDGVVIVDGAQMFNIGNQASYNLTSTETSKLGMYKVAVACTTNADGFATMWYEVTGNGKEKPDGVVIVLFSIIFLIILGTLGYLVIYSFGHLLTLDHDLKDLGYNLGAFLALFGAIFLADYYLGNPAILDILNVILWVSVFGNVFLPFVAFMISLFMGKQVRASKLEYRGGLMQ